MRTTTRHRFAKSGALALLPRAWGGEFESIVVAQGGAPPPFSREGDAAVVDICGPLVNRAEGLLALFCDSYQAIRERVEAACDSDAKAVVLRFDSPGGDVAGMTELATDMRAMALVHGKRLVAFTDATCASAAFALACSADEIVVTPTGLVGSIGVIQGLADQAKLDAAMGLTYAFVTSGTRKTDGNPHVAISEDAIAATKAHVDELAGVFFAHVEAMRGLPASSVRELDGGIFYGASAVAAGLADRVSTWAETIAAISGEQQETANMKPKASKYDEAMGALKAAAEGEGEDAEKAKKALKAMSDDGDEGKEGKEPAAKAKAAEEDDKKKDADAKAAKAKAEADEKKDAEAKALAANAMALAQEVQALKAQAAAREASEAEAKVAAARAALFAKRPDFSEAVRATLANVPIADLAKAVETWPRVNAAPGSSAAAMLAAGGEDPAKAKAQYQPRLTAAEQRLYDACKPAAAGPRAAVVTGNVLQMPPMLSQADAAKRVAELEAQMKGGHQ